MSGDNVQVTSPKDKLLSNYRERVDHLCKKTSKECTLLGDEICCCSVDCSQLGIIYRVSNDNNLELTMTLFYIYVKSTKMHFVPVGSTIGGG